ncbi:D-glycerate dehydrogenase [Lottiidibacillus patelloidae]|uniref:D-glycerate dehydrogenase n=1 Tax=Lottiidibacillus patelloidae TaxID=2670334 RepID=A0A263BQH6_9BACI|nr:D-glycerate dehydrogenase [Lottiidibacillus patelloidae]OZM55960.1 D-glycerate dehydrogenase [Lottiidibacillus patelloidae]
MEKPFVYITRKLPEELLEPLKQVATIEMWPHDDQPIPYDKLKEKAKKASGLLTMLSDQIDASLLEASPHLKVVANMAVGYDNIDVAAAKKNDITVCNTPDVLTNSTAELTFALMLATARRICEAEQYVKEGKWINWSPFLLAGQDLFRKKLGIVGMGRIGQAVAKRAKGFDMDIYYHNRSRNEHAEAEYGATYLSFHDLISSCDYIICLTPLTSETVKLFNATVFKEMKDTAIFINVSRGAVVDEAALYEALVNKEIAGAGLDVFEKEPIQTTHPLLSLKNVVALPHIGSASVATRWKMGELAVENILAVLQGSKGKTIVE